MASESGVGMTGVCILNHLSGSILSRVAVGRRAAAVGGRGCLEAGLEWTLGRARGIKSTAVAMAPIKVTVGPVRLGLTPSSFSLPSLQGPPSR